MAVAFAVDTLTNAEPGNFNIAMGFQALFGNTNGPSNTAVGVQAPQNNSNGLNNTATCVLALTANTTGDLKQRRHQQRCLVPAPTIIFGRNQAARKQST